MIRGRRPHTNTGGSERGDDFYSQMASLAGDLDSSETEGSGAEFNPSSPTQLDVDNLDANLFSSLKTTSKNRPGTGGRASPSPSKLTTASTEKKTKGIDMGELSKLLGTNDIMKDLSSTTKKPTVESILAATGTKSVTLDKTADSQIKKDADDLLDMLSSNDFEFGKKSRLAVSSSGKSTSGAHGKPVSSGVTTDIANQPGKPLSDHKKIETESDNLLDILSSVDYGHSSQTKSEETDNKKAATSVGRPTSPVVSGAQKNPTEGLTGDQPNTSKPPLKEMKPIKMAATVNFDSDDGEDLLAGLGLADGNGGKKESSKKSVRFSEEVSTKLLETPKKQEMLEPPKFPWQKKKLVQEQPSVVPPASEDNHVTVSQATADKLEPPKFPWQKNIQQDSRLKTLSLPEDSTSQYHSQNVLGLDDPFATTSTKNVSSDSQKQSTDSSFGDLLARKSPKSASLDLGKQSKSEALDSLRQKDESDCLAKTASISPKAPAPKQTFEGMLDLGDPFAKKPKQPAKPKVINQRSSAQSQSDAQIEMFKDLSQLDNLSAKKPSSKISPTPTSDCSPVISVPSPHLTEGRQHVEMGSGSAGAAENQEILQRALKRAKEAEAALEKEWVEHAQSKRLLVETESKLLLSHGEIEKWKMQTQGYKTNMSETEATRQNMLDELLAKLKDTTLALQKMEMEYSHGQQMLESTKKRNEDELESLKQSHSLRITSLEDSLGRTEARWKEELSLEIARWQDKLKEAEKEKSEAVQVLQNKVDSLEISRISEIDQLKNNHMILLENLKKDHEAYKQQLDQRHSEEIKAIKEAQSHTRTLTALNSKVEASSQVVSQLREKLAEEHGKVLEEREKRNRAQENQLKVMEDRLLQQQMENETERSRLQGLIAKMEAHISQQNRTVEQERWTLQQDQARLKAQQTAFHEELLLSRKRLEEDREQFQQSREQFLTEQQDILAKCYQEQRKISLEKTEASFRRKKAEDYEISFKQISQQAELDRNASISHLNEELIQMEVEKRKLSKFEEELKVERRLISDEKEKLQKFTDDVCTRSKEVDAMCKNAMDMKQLGEKELKEAQELKRELISQQEHFQRELSNLRRKEIHVSEGHLDLLEQKKQFQQQMQLSLITVGAQVGKLPEPVSTTNAAGPVLLQGPVPVLPTDNSVLLPAIENRRHLHPLTQPHQQQSQPLHSSTFIPPSSPPPCLALSNGSLPLMQSSPINQHCHQPQLTTKFAANSQHSRPNSSRLSSSRNPAKSTSIHAYLQQLEHNVYVRKDNEELDKQQTFLASLTNSHMKL